MRFLFVHQNFPGQYLHLIRRLVAEGTHEIVFISERNGGEMPGVRKVVYATLVPGEGTHRDAWELDMAVRRAEAVANVARTLRSLGFDPDVILGHEGWGEMLNLPDVWPDAPRIGYQEFFYRLRGVDLNFDGEFPASPVDYSRVRAKNAVSLLSLNNGGQGQCPTRFQRSTYPGWAQPDLALLPEGVDLDTCRPDPRVRNGILALEGFAVAPEHALVTFVSRDLEPYRGFHVLMRALPRLLAARPDLRVVMVGGDGVSYGAPPPQETWRALLLRELAGRIDLSRVHFPGRVEYGTYLRLLQRSDAHVYLTYPFVASWSLREALACGCALVGSDTEPVREFVRHEANGLLTPCLDPAALAASVLRLLEDRRLAARLRQEARRGAEQTLRLEDTLQGYGRLIGASVARGGTRA